MDNLQNLRSEMRSKFLALFKSSASEEKFIEFIRLSLQQQGSNKFDIKALEIVLDLTLAVVDQYGCAKFNYDRQPVPQLDASNNSGSAAAGRDDGHNPGGTLLEEPPIANSSGVSPRLAPELVSYDADDEDFDDTFIFPCHLVYDNCHPELLSDYHREHLTPSRTSTQIVKLPKVCEFVIESMFKNLLSYIYNPKPLEFESSASSDVFSAAQDHVSHSESIPPGRKDFAEPEDDNLNLTSYLNMAVNLVKKLNKACVNERRNCKILSRTRMLNILMQNLILLIGEIPDKQHIYLEPLLKFSFTLADYKIQGTHLKQLFTIIKNENTDLKTVLKNFEQILTHHSKILRNIQPSKSINFPTASKTPEEIEYDHYVANSWHWRLRSKVIEYKRKRSRTDSQSQELESKAAAIMSQQLALADISNQHDIQESQSATGNKSAPKAAGQEPDGARRNSVIPATSNRITSSWLECSLMTPLSNIMPLTHDNELKFCCSMWISICGDLLVIEGTKSRQHRRTDASGNGDHFNIDWSQLDGHWLRLTSRRRLVRRHKNKVVVRPRPRKRRLSAKIRNRQAFDKEDEEREEIEEKVRRSEAELTQMSHNGRGRFRLFHSSLSRQTRNSAIKKQRDSILKKTKIDDQKTSKRFQGLSESTPPREYLGRRARDNSQELLIHLVSFAIDSLTIEIWLNVKSMTFCARACRVTREGQTNLLDQVTFPSHLESNGNWSNLMFCLEEQNKNSSEKVMNFKVIVNGVHKEKEKLVYSAHKSPLTNFALLIGCERSTFGYVWKLSQVNIYKSIPDKSMPIYLLGKGPDFWSFTNFRQPSLLPLPDVSQRYAKIVMSPKALMRYSLIDEEQALNWLTQNIMISYVAHQPDHFMDYSPSLSSASLINPLPADYEFSNSAERFIQAKTLDFSRSMRFNQNVGFGSALVEAGGVESVLICFAEVVRRSHETAQVHALAFSVLLKMAQTNLYHLNKFLDELNGLKLIEFILAHPNCKVSREMLESYLDFCLMKQGERHLIKSPKLIFNLMTSWRAWHKDLKVAKLLYKRFIKLLQPPEASRKINNRQQQDEHKLQTFYTNHNFRMMSQAGGIDILMDVLRESLVAVESENSIRINHELVELIVNLISLLIKHPPGLDVMLDIMEFLLFLHPDPKAYVEVSANKISFLHQIKPLEVDAEIMFDEVVPSRVRTPSTRTSQSSLRSSDEDMDQYGAAVRRNGARSINRLKQSKQVVSGQSSQDDLFTTLENRISDQCSRNLAEIIEEFSESQRLASNEDVRYAWFQHRFNDGYAADANQIFRPYQQRELEPRCSNRNFAIANIADMLASIVKLASTDPMKILSEALQKPIIDPRKLVILANNESSLVREKVLRLFLYCIRACYSLNLKSVLASFEQETKSENYRICTPIHLMARQLLKHPATIRMVQLCYGIIMGVDDFETVDTVCLEFDIEPINNHLQLNTLVLLMHLLTQLRLTQDIVPGLKFIHAYLRQLLQLGEVTTVGFMIESSLIDCLMNLYFNYVENVIAQARDLKRHRSTAAAAAAAESGSEGKSNNQKNGSVQGDQENQCDQVADEIDRLLLFVVQFYIQNSSSVRLTKSVEDLLMYLELLNTYLPDKYHYILRDRKAKILITLLRYCRHYEESARQRAYGGKMEYYLKSFFKNNDLNRFSNNLPECELANMFDRSSDLKVLAAFDSQDDSSGSSDSGEEDDLSGPTQEGRNGSLQSNGSSDRGAANDQRALSVGSIGSSLDEHCARVPPSDSRLISEADVVERFRATFEFVLTFVVTRGANIIPSPLERSFIVRSLQILANYLIGNQHAKNGKARHRTHWTLMLPKLEALFKGSFSRLVLYLLSPCEAMNIDERKYYAHQILGTFRIDQLLNMLVEDSSRSHHKVLLAFAKELVEHSATSQAPSSDGNGTSSEMDDDDDDDDVEEDELVDETEIKLRQLIRGLEFEVGEEDSGNQSRLSSYVYGKRMRPTLEDNDGRLTKLDAKYRDIWLVDLHQALEDYRERLLCLKMELKSSSSSSSSPSSSSNQATVSAKVRSSSMDKLTSPALDDTAANRLIDEAINITKDVVNDKHEQRKAHLEDVKQGKVYNYHIRQQWLSLIIGHTHERAIWYLEDYYPSSWELNPVEGPSRTRRRLRPCKLALEARFLRGGRRGRRRAALNDCLDSAASSPSASRNSRLDDDLNADDWYYQYSPHPLCSLVINNEQHVGSHELRIRMFTTDKIHFNCDCSIIRPNEVCVGEVSIASWCIHFIGEQSDGYQRRLNDNQRRDRAGIRPMSARRLGRHLIANGGGSGGSSSNSCRPPKNQDTANTYEGEDSPFDEQDTKASLNSGSRRPCVASTVVEDLWFDEIVEIWDRRYQLQDVGLEIFLTNNMTYLMSFRNNHDREEFKQHLIREQHKMINLQRFNLTTSLNRLTLLWREGKLTNFDYLTCLNKLSGRSFNDLMQYPVFPFVLSNYMSEHLDLTAQENYRELSRPMAIQKVERETNFRNNYQMSQSSSLSIGGALGLSKPYHYGNHYSNSATVLHFLVRLPPFTQMLIQYQDNNFDQPDRTFHSVANTWQLITRDSNTDFKELIPEFFFLPEMFTNIEALELGRKQNNQLVDDVRLPVWCPNSDARLFTLIHRQALESAYVSENLHHWIDLIFGYKQTGKAAEEAVNVFHPATYYGGVNLKAGREPMSGSGSAGSNSLSAINLTIATQSARSVAHGSDYIANGTDAPAPNQLAARTDLSPLGRLHQADIERSALETMIKTYGQMPRQLFSQPMKQRKDSTFVPQINEVQLERHQEKMMAIENGNGSGKKLLASGNAKKLEPIRQVKGLRWGDYVGSPDEKEVIAVRHKRIILEEPPSYRAKGSKSRKGLLGGGGGGGGKQSGDDKGPKLLSKRSDKFHFCLLTNGDVAILRNNTSLMLDYRADRKSSGTTTYQLSAPSARYSRRAGLSRVSRMNLFSNMIISRQQFSFLEPIYSPANQLNTFASTDGASTLASLTGTSQRVKFSLDSLNLVSWFYLDGTIRVKHPATSNLKPSIPLVQANTIVDTMSTCASVPELNLLLVGYKSGSICAHIVSTSYETAPLPRYIPTISIGASRAAAAALSASAAAPSAVHSLHTTSTHGIDVSLLGPGRVTGKTITGEPYSAITLAGKTLQSVRSMNKTTRWLYCHNKRVNCIKINVSFGIVVTGSDDGTSVIWDLNSLTYVRTIDYKISSLRLRNSDNESQDERTTSTSTTAAAAATAATAASPHGLSADNYSWTYGRARKEKVYDYLCNCHCATPRGSHHAASVQPNSKGAGQTDCGETDCEEERHLNRSINDFSCMVMDMVQQCCICGSGISLIAISDTLGDVVTVKSISNRMAMASGENESGRANGRLTSTPSGQSISALSSTTTTSSSSASSDSNSTTSIIYIHTINGFLVNFVNCHSQVTAVAYSHAPEGISINVIVVGMVDGLVRLYSSWDLSRVKEFRVSGLCSPISSIMYTRDSQLMYIAYEDGQMVVLRTKRKGSFSMPKEWIL